MYWFFGSFIPWSAFLFLKFKKVLHMYQQNLYNDNHRYTKWLIKNYKKVLFDIDFLAFILFSIISIFIGGYPLMIIFVVMYIMLSYFYYQRLANEKAKKPLVITARARRLIITTFIINIVPIASISLVFTMSQLDYYYLYTNLLTYLLYLTIYLVNGINFPIERGYYFYFKYQAKKKLKSMPNLKVIGITGSYGKTSSKNILSDILSIKYNPLPSPKSLNTPNGLMITVNNHLDKFHDILIAEMGAYRLGEIKQLCRLVGPKYGILTKIGDAHLETFGSQTNIQKTKFELIEYLPTDGTGVLNRDDELQVNYSLKNKCKILWIGIERKDVDVHASNIKMSNEGTTFEVTFKGDKQKYPFITKLLGYANIYNILTAIALGREFGITIDQLQNSVKKVKPVEHRLELKKSGDINIIDDAYNSNPIGAKMALEVLSIMPGKKIIVTPGMVELGEKQYELNKLFGQQIADVCDEVILVGEKQTKPIQDGLNDKKYNQKKIHIVNDVKLAFDIINKIKTKETYVLLENDLPDTYNE